MIKRFVCWYLSKIKNTNYVVDDNLSSKYLLGMIFARTIMLARGILHFRKMVFVGRNVNFRSKENIKISSGCMLGDYACLDGLSLGGITLGIGVSLGRLGKIRSTATLVSLGAGVNIGDYVGIGDGFYLGGFGGIEIGANTIVGERFTVHSDNHYFDDMSSLIRNQGVEKKPVSIGDNCWMGSNVTILGGVKIGSGSVIGAGSIVTRSFPGNSVIVGNPARLIRSRGAME